MGGKREVSGANLESLEKSEVKGCHLRRTRKPKSNPQKGIPLGMFRIKAKGETWVSYWRRESLHPHPTQLCSFPPSAHWDKATGHKHGGGGTESAKKGTEPQDDRTNTGISNLEKTH